MATLRRFYGFLPTYSDGVAFLHRGWAWRDATLEAAMTNATPPRRDQEPTLDGSTRIWLSRMRPGRDVSLGTIGRADPAVAGRDAALWGEPVGAAAALSLPIGSFD